MGIIDFYQNSTLLLPLVFIVSLFLGSFYNVVALRTVKGESIAFPPSHCTSCNHRLGAKDLVPVISWLTLGGKCRYCKSPISKIYPFGELLTAVSYTLMVWKYELTLEALIHIIMISVLIWATVSDLKTMEVPDRFVLIGTALVIPLRYIQADNLEQFGFYIISGIACFAVMFILLLVGGMGGADVKLYALIGLTLGVYDGGISLFYAAFVATAYHLPSMLNKKVKGKTEIPFVPFITVGVLLTYVLPALKLIEIIY